MCLVSSTKHSVGRNKSNGGEAIARLSPNASSCPCIVERNDQDLVVFAGRFVDPPPQKKKKPVVSSRYLNKTLRRDPKRTISPTDNCNFGRKDVD